MKKLWGAIPTNFRKQNITNDNIYLTNIIIRDIMQVDTKEKGMVVVMRPEKYFEKNGVAICKRYYIDGKEVTAKEYKKKSKNKERIYKTPFLGDILIIKRGYTMEYIQKKIALVKILEAKIERAWDRGLKGKIGRAREITLQETREFLASLGIEY